MALNYTSGEDLAYQTSFGAAAQAAGERRPTAASPTRRRPTSAPAAARGGATATQHGAAVAVQQRVVEEKVGRNDPCPCGSGRSTRSATGLEPPRLSAVNAVAFVRSFAERDGRLRRVA